MSGVVGQNIGLINTEPLDSLCIVVFKQDSDGNYDYYKDIFSPVVCYPFTTETYDAVRKAKGLVWSLCKFDSDPVFQIVPIIPGMKVKL